MRTQADQVEINQKRLEAELCHTRLIASQQAQRLSIVNFADAAMRRDALNQPHVIYKVYTGGGQPPSPPSPPMPAVDPMRQVEALERRLREERQ